MSSDSTDDAARSLMRQVDEIGARFEEAWKSGSEPRIEDFLQQLPGDTNPELLLALIERDVVFRSEQGAAPDLETYTARFPEQASRIRNSLSAAHGRTVLPETDHYPAPVAGGAAEIRQQRQSISRRVGPYRLLEKLGEGGMGEVYLAEQLEPIKRRVALKLIRTGLDSDQTLARFEAERQALAMMDHRHIARILDGGITPEGQPYFTMELVQGVAITQYCDRHRLSIRDRLQLFLQVCRAIQHAHQKGILHRDLKPSNVLVTQSDGSPMAKVIDFGLARTLQSDQRLTDKTLHTGIGRVVGTLEYMSPEQADTNELGLDTRTDVYSLGVLLYELLTGSTPLGRERVRQEAYHRVVQLIVSEEAPAPSRRLSNSGDAITGISAQRQIEPRRLGGILKGELDWIALKALAKERDRRYDGAGALADDVRHYLDGEVVLARPPSAGYRLRKAIGRNRVAFVSGLVFVVSLLAGLVGTGTMWRRAHRETQRANMAQTRATREAVHARTAETTAHTEAVKARAAEATAKQNLFAAEQNAYIFDMLLAQRDWDDADIGHLAERLNRYRDRDDLKGFEWSYWDRLIHRSLSTLEGHSLGVNSVCFSRDGKRIVSGAGHGSEAGEIIVWDAETGRQLLMLNGHMQAVKSVNFSPDGKRFVSGGSDSTVKVWDAATGRQSLTLKGHTQTVENVSFSPDGKRIVSGSDDRTLKVWDAETGREQLTLTCGKWVHGAAFSPDGTWIVGCSADKTVRVWDAETGRQLLMLNGHMQAVNSVNFSPDGKRIVSGGSDSTVKVWDAATGRQPLTLKGHTQSVTNVSFSPDGQWIVTGGSDNTLKVWDATGGQLPLTLKGHSGHVNSAAFSPDGRRIVSGSQDTTLKLWDLATGPEPLVLKGHLESHLDQPICASFSSDGHRIVSGSHSDGHRIVSGSHGSMLTVWDADTGLAALTFKAHADRVSSVSFSPDGTRILSSSAPTVQYDFPDFRFRNDRTLKIWNATTGQAAVTVKGHPKGVSSASFSPDGQWIVSAGYDRLVKLWDATTGQEKLTFKGHSGAVRSAKFSPDGKQIVSGSEDKTLKLWDVATGQESLSLTGHMQAVSEVNFSPNGKWIVSGSHDRTLKVWNASTGQMRWTLKGHKGMITDVGFSADGKRILSSSDDKTLKLWDVATGQETITLKGHTGSINYASFSPDGNRIVSGSAADRTIRVWDARSWSLEQRIVRQAAAVVRTAWQNDFTKDDVVQQIRNSQTVPVAVRRKALQLVKPLSGPTAATLNNQSWQIVRRMQSTHSESRRALRQIQAAVSLEPDNAHYRNTLGVAQYRVGDYAGAADTLARSEELVRTDFGMESPLDSVVLAMALFRLGNTDAAGKRMEQLRVVARQPALSKNVEFLNFLREAEGLIGAEQEKQDRSTR